MPKLHRGKIIVAVLILALTAGWICVLQHISDVIHMDAVAAEARERIPPPPSEWRAGAWRLTMYGQDQCTWVAGHLQRGRWVEGYWRRKPGAVPLKPSPARDPAREKGQ